MQCLEVSAELGVVSLVGTRSTTLGILGQLRVVSPHRVQCIDPRRWVHRAVGADALACDGPQYVVATVTSVCKSALVRWKYPEATTWFVSALTWDVVSPACKSLHTPLANPANTFSGMLNQSPTWDPSRADC